MSFPLRTRGPGIALASMLVVGLLAGPVAASAPPRTAPTAVPEYASDRIVVQYAGDPRPTVVRSPPQRLADTLEALEADPAVEYAERDVVVRADVTPNDPHWPQQWGPEKVRAPHTWTTTSGSADVVVAVLDSGVDARHADLRGAMVPGRNVIAGTGDTDDDNGHGTAAASVVAARSNNATGMAGMCWQCAIMPVKVLGADGSGFVSDLAQGIVWATDNGASVINMSLSSTASTKALESAVRYATERDVVLVASAGNHGTTTPAYPAANPDVVAVAASDQRDGPYDFTARGSWVDVAAPGCNTAARAQVKGGDYSTFCGTSSASPVVAGALALGRTAGPDADVTTLRTELAATAVGVGSWVRHGRIDTGAFVDAVAGSEDSAPAPSPEPAPEPAPEPTPEPDPEPAAERSPERSPEAAPRPAASSDRLAGDSRFATAARISAATQRPGVDRVYVGTGRKYPDALAAGPAAAFTGGSVLLTEATSLPAATASELERLRPKEIVLAGGTGTVSDGVLQALQRYGPVRRLAGTDRYETAAAIATDAFPGPVPVVYISSGRNFPDALSGGAAAGAEDGPLLLTEPSRLPAATERAITALRPARIVVVGGAGAVGAEVVASLRRLTGGSVARLSGPNRFETSAAISGAAFSRGTDVVFLATGLDFPDALSGGPAAAAQAGPLLLVKPTSLPSATADELRRLRPRTVVALGGRNAVSDATLEAARTAANQ